MTHVAFETRPNPDLRPQSSDNVSVGFDFRLTDNIDVGASWVAIDFTDRIVAPTGNVVGSNLSCIVTDGNDIPIEDANGNLNWIAVADGGCMVPKDPTVPIDQSNLGLIVSQPINLGYLDAEFLDLRANMRLDTGIGALSFTPSVTFVTKYEFPLPERVGGRDGLCPGGLCSAIGRNIGRGFANGISSMPRWQGNFPVTLTTGDHRFRVNASYRDSLNEAVEDLDPSAAATANFVHEDGQWVVDVQWTWQFTEGTSIGFSSRNLFATEPPLHQAARFNRRLREYSLQFRHSFAN